uniref:Uncharacterized protein n=1 Tax=Anguilla anguilla TaxID=7936 RepID=A0A0E9WH80_ANGAN
MIYMLTKVCRAPCLCVLIYFKVPKYALTSLTAPNYGT